MSRTLAEALRRGKPSELVRSVIGRPPVRWYGYAWRGGPCIAKLDSPTKSKLGRAEMAALLKAMEEGGPVRGDMLAGRARAWRASPEWEALGT